MVGYNSFDWTAFENILNDSASRNMHVVCRFYIHYPGNPMQLPAHLVGVVPMIDTEEEPTPDYNANAMVEAYSQFISALGARYDGDKRIGFIQAGLLGFWGKLRCCVALR